MGSAAPDFSLADDSGHIVKLSDLRGKNVVLVFYPGDDTPDAPGSSASSATNGKPRGQAGSRYPEWNPQSARSHARFRDKHRLPFPLLVDQGRKAAKLYHASGLIVKRTVYLIGPDGAIRSRGGACRRRRRCWRRSHNGVTDFAVSKSSPISWPPSPIPHADVIEVYSVHVPPLQREPQIQVESQHKQVAAREHCDSRIRQPEKHKGRIRNNGAALIVEPRLFSRPCSLYHGTPLPYRSRAICLSVSLRKGQCRADFSRESVPSSMRRTVRLRGGLVAARFA